MADRFTVDLPPTDVILAILSGRPWATPDNHIWNDRAWDYVSYSGHPDYDFPIGAPSNTTMERAYRSLMEGGAIIQAPGLPRAFEATERGHRLGKKPQLDIRAAIARS